MTNTLNKENKPYNAMLKFESDKICDFEATLQLNHTHEGEATNICTINGFELRLFGCIQLTTPEGDHLTGNKLVEFIRTKTKATKDELFQFLKGEKPDAFKGYWAHQTPFMEWFDENNEALDEQEYSIPADINRLKKPT